MSRPKGSKLTKEHIQRNIENELQCEFVRIKPMI